MMSQPCPAGLFCKQDYGDGDQGLNSYPTSTANGCSAGHYCPEKTTDELDCPIGRFRATKGGRFLTDCHLATAGYYADVQELTSLTGKECDPGYYCPAGSSSSTEKACPAGTYRTLNKARSALDCATCTAGNYCQNAGTSTPVPCIAGHYCPRGTINPIPCPRGTFGPLDSGNPPALKGSTECTPCSAGSYCGQRGADAVTAQCTEGYLCISGASIPTPTDGATGSLCPAGGYCPQGATAAQPCPQGKFNNFEGSRTDAECNPCTPGKYCTGTNSPTPDGDCDEGYWCEEGAYTA